jgi:NitT/TauT family transport system ATP-binding protein
MEALALVGLADHAGKLPREMSGGMKMRVAVARALAGGPDLVLLDEPFAAVDDFTRWELLELTSRILDDLGASVVHVTHSLSEAVFIADRIIVMSGHPAHRTTEQVVPVPRPRAGEIRFDASFGDAVAGLAGAVASTCSLTSGPRATGTAER